MITITDATGHSLTLDDVEMTSAEVQRRIEDLMHGSAHQVIDVGGAGFAVAYCSAPVAWDRIHAPPPTSARWEGPPPRRARR